MIMQDKPLYGFEINNALGNLAELLSVDQLPTLGGPILAVCNTSESNTSGSHWVVICIDRQQRAEFFDSFGMHPIVYGFAESLEHARQLTYNNVILRHPSSSVCGYYAIAYSRAKLCGISISDFLTICTNDKLANDKTVYKWVNLPE